jgi:hypothetical protein
VRQHIQKPVTDHQGREEDCCSETALLQVMDRWNENQGAASKSASQGKQTMAWGSKGDASGEPCPAGAPVTSQERA